MSNDPLRVKLIAAGYDEEIVIGMERELLQSNYAEILPTGGGAKGGVGLHHRCLHPAQRPQFGSKTQPH